MQSYKENSHLPYPSHCKSPYSRQNNRNQDPTINKIVTKSRTSENNYGRSLMPIKPLAPKNSFYNSNEPSTSYANQSSSDYIDHFHEISNSYSETHSYSDPTVGHFRPRESTNRTSLNAFGHSEGKMSTVEVPKATDTHTKSFQVKPRQNQLRLFTGSVENLMYWSKLRTSLHILFEVTGTVISIQPSVRDMEKCFWISDCKSGPKLQVVFYEIDRPLQKLMVSSVVTCIGRLMTRNRMQAYKVVESSEEQKSDLERLSFICNRVADEISATQKK